MQDMATFTVLGHSKKKTSCDMADLYFPLFGEAVLIQTIQGI